MIHLTKIQLFAVWVLPIVFAITVHEVAHGVVAKLLGDKTASVLGRLTLNPMRHIDLIGTIIVPTVLLLLGGIMFGWAKPVPINPSNFRRPRRDIALVAAAGPFSNIIMAIAWGLIAKLGMFLLQQGFSWALAITYMGNAGIMMNGVLAILNLLPLPPLDGGNILISLLPKSLAARVALLAPFGFFILLFLVASGVIGIITTPLVQLFYGSVTGLLGL
jgi:Zn-dependent protease